MIKKTFLLLCICTLSLFAQDLKVAAGAGYKKVVQKIIQNYEKNNQNVDGFFGNMKQVTAQSQQTDMGLVIGDKSYLLNKSQLNIKEYITLGYGKVVLAYAKGVQLTTTNDLLKTNIRKIAMPQPQKAIYGIAGMEFLKEQNLYKTIKDKLLVVSSVPQVMTYLVAKEVDVGIVNLTSALENKDKIGGYIEIDANDYSPIEIIAAKLPDCKNECEQFVNYLQTDESKKIFKTFGL
ncbi:MAG: molybdate ABC transporter substrate-binding protein [Candidatus Marinarcus sp.]|uniref:molybdate ABC transporter substrate-binding protein n=1 Tax=Candidatus Marinarcus sp. TaxID=3100987 RepID=UPI003AFF84CF